MFITTEHDLSPWLRSQLLIFGFISLCGAIIFSLLAMLNQGFTRRISLPLQQISDMLRVESLSGKNTDLKPLLSVELTSNSTEIRDFIAAYHNVLSRYHEAKDASLKREKESATAHAIARTTQMLAHDVRKPFTMFRMIIDAVESAENSGEAIEILRESLPDVQQAIASVNGMIQDIMEIGSDTKLTLENAFPESLIELTLNEIFRVFPESKVSIHYDFQHKLQAKVDTRRVQRVFLNLVGNALQAMRYSGSIWFSTREIVEGELKFIQFSVGNRGSHIPEEHISRLFDAFFTAGKKDGTGLGLAIAQKIVVAHGGKIWCKSEIDEQFPDGKVEFYFTLPAGTELAKECSATLPTGSHEIAQISAIARRLTTQKENTETAVQEMTLERELLRLLNKQQSQLSVLLVDDEAVYRNALNVLLNRSELLSPWLKILCAKSGDEALSLAAHFDPDLIILDVDLGACSLNGLRIAKLLRLNGSNSRICMHSNRFLTDDYKDAIEAGANTVLPKPMSLAHLLKLLIEAAEARFFLPVDGIRNGLLTALDTGSDQKEDSSNPAFLKVLI